QRPDRTGMALCPQRCGQPAGGVGEQDRRPVGADPAQGLVDLLVVALQRVDRGGGLSRQQTPSMLAQVQCPDVVPLFAEVVEQVTVEDVAGPAVPDPDRGQVAVSARRACGTVAGPAEAVDARGDPRALVVVAEIDPLSGV